MQTPEDRIKEIEDILANTPHHKATNKFIGKMRARIAKIRAEIWEKAAGGGGGGGSGGYAVRKTGDASVVLFGFPSVGKSTLINQLTNAQSKVASYDFTTLEVIPGMMDYRGAKIQVFDIPGIIEGASMGKGKGKQVLSVVRSANLIIIVLDPKTMDKLEILKKELLESGVRLDQFPPKVSINKEPSGGLRVTSNLKLPFDLETVKEIASEFRLPNGEVIIKENITMDQLIDCFMGNRVYVPSLVVLNKMDLLPANHQQVAELEISADKKVGLEELKEKIWEKLGLIRVYLKPEGGQADMNSPYIIHQGKSLQNIIENISICNKATFIAAKVSGPGAKFPNQEVSLTFIPQEGTIIEFVS